MRFRDNSCGMNAAKNASVNTEKIPVYVATTAAFCDVAIARIALWVVLVLQVRPEKPRLPRSAGSKLRPLQPLLFPRPR
jgi:hypothetical protein